MIDDQSHKAVLKRATIITLITVLSRIAGYVRDQRITFLLGSGLAADAFSAAYRIPDILRRLVSEGAVTASFVPIFTHKLREKSWEECWEFVNSLFTFLTLILTGVVLLGMLLPVWVFITAAGLFFHQQAWVLSVDLNKIMLAYVVFIGLSALASGILNCFHRYAIPAFTPVVLNLAIIGASFAGGYWANPSQASLWLAMGVVLGGVLQVCIQLPLLRKLGFRFKPVLRSHSPEVRKVLACMLPGFLGAGVFHFGLLINTQYASFLGVGSTASLYYSDRVIELVMGGYVLSFAIAVLPMFARQASLNLLEEMKRTISFSIRIVCFVTIPTMFVLVLMRRPIIEVLFQHGEFNRASTEVTAWALCFLAFSLPFQAVIKILAQAFYAMKDFKTPAMMAGFALAINVLMAGVLFKWMGVGGLSLATSLALIFDMAVLLIIFRRRYGPFEHEERLLAALGRIFFCSLLLGGTSYMVITLPGFYTHASFGMQVLAFSTSIMAGVLVYFVGCWLMKAKEMEEFWGVVIQDRYDVRLFEK